MLWNGLLQAEAEQSFPTRRGNGQQPANRCRTDPSQGWIDTISPQGVLNYDEESSRALFESGNAVFHRNWPYVWGTSQAPAASC